MNYEKVHQRMDKLVSRLTYKPNFSLRYISYSDAEIRGVGCTTALCCYAVVADVTDERQCADLRISRTCSLDVLDGMSDEEILQSVVLPMIREFEMHEINEWFKCDGKCVNEPHPELKAEELESVRTEVKDAG